MKTDSQFEKELKTLRAEMRKPKPDGEKVFKLLCGDKYNEPICKK